MKCLFWGQILPNQVRSSKRSTLWLALVSFFLIWFVSAPTVTSWETEQQEWSAIFEEYDLLDFEYEGPLLKSSLSEALALPASERASELRLNSDAFSTLQNVDLRYYSPQRRNPPAKYGRSTKRNLFSGRPRCPARGARGLLADERCRKAGAATGRALLENLFLQQQRWLLLQVQPHQQGNRGERESLRETQRHHQQKSKLKPHSQHTETPVKLLLHGQQDPYSFPSPVVPKVSGSDIHTTDPPVSKNKNPNKRLNNTKSKSILSCPTAPSLPPLWLASLYQNTSAAAKKQIKTKPAAVVTGQPLELLPKEVQQQPQQQQHAQKLRRKKAGSAAATEDEDCPPENISLEMRETLVGWPTDMRRVLGGLETTVEEPEEVLGRLPFSLLGQNAYSSFAEPIDLPPGSQGAAVSDNFGLGATWVLGAPVGLEDTSENQQENWSKPNLWLEGEALLDALYYTLSLHAEQATAEALALGERPGSGRAGATQTVTFQFGFDSVPLHEQRQIRYEQQRYATGDPLKVFDFNSPAAVQMAGTEVGSSVGGDFERSVKDGYGASLVEGLDGVAALEAMNSYPLSVEDIRLLLLLQEEAGGTVPLGTIDWGDSTRQVANSKSSSKDNIQGQLEDDIDELQNLEDFDSSWEWLFEADLDGL